MSSEAASFFPYRVGSCRTFVVRFERRTLRAMWSRETAGEKRGRTEKEGNDRTTSAKVLRWTSRAFELIELKRE